MSSDSQRSTISTIRNAALWGALLLLVVAGCSGSNRRGPAARQGSEKDLFNSIAQTLNTLEEYDTDQILPQLRDRLNHWQEQETPAIEWHVDSLVAELPQRDRDLGVMKSLDDPIYAVEDMILMQEMVWLRDISRAAGAMDELPAAQALFDWTIRNIQLEPDGKDGAAARHYPLEILLLGRGNAAERAWIFMLLCRQQKIDAVMLAVPGKDDVAPRLWLPAVVSGKQLYLFDTRLGLPIPGPASEPIATLEQVAADDSLLRKLDLDAEHPYPWKSDDVKHVVALIEASPEYLAKRTKLIDSQLTGQWRVVMSTSPEALAKRVTALANVQSAKLWSQPYDVIHYKRSLDDKGRQAAQLEMLIMRASTPLSKGRMRQFKRIYTGEDGAKKYYLAARASTPDLDQFRDQRERAMSKDPAQRKAQQARLDFEVSLLEASNEQASLCLGLVAFEQADFPVAVDFFERRVLETSEGGPHTPSATYNLARTYEEWGLSVIDPNYDDTKLAKREDPDKELSGAKKKEPTDEDWARLAKAIEVYESDKSEQSHGNKLRARQLKAKVEVLKTAADKSKPTKTEPAKAEPAKPEAEKPETTKPAEDPAKPEKPAATELTKPESEKPAEPTKVEPAKPEPTKPSEDSVNPDDKTEPAKP